MKDRSLSEKIISPVIFDTSFIQMAKCSLPDEKIVYQSFYGAPLTFSCFVTSRKRSVFDTSRQNLRDIFLLRRLCRKNFISSYTWHKSFIQTVKCSFFNQIIIKVSVARCSVFFFFTSRKSCVSAVELATLWLARWLLSKAFRRPCWKNYISRYIRHKSFIQTVKCSLFN